MIGRIRRNIQTDTHIHTFLDKDGLKVCICKHIGGGNQGSLILESAKLQDATSYGK